MTQRIPYPTPASASRPAAYRDAAELPLLVTSFLERLRRLPLGAWIDAGRRLEELDRRGTLGARRSAGAVRSQLRLLVNGMPHVAPRVRQRVSDLAAATQGFVHPAEAARMKKAALAAALGLAARPALGPERFADVYEPFAALIPLTSLAGETAREPTEISDDPQQAHGAARGV